MICWSERNIFNRGLLISPAALAWVSFSGAVVSGFRGWAARSDVTELVPLSHSEHQSSYHVNNCL